MMKNFNLFLTNAQNIDCGTNDLYFRANLRKMLYTPVNPSFTIKVGLDGVKMATTC